MAVTLGIVLAGGRGMRLGLGTPKALARVGGATLLARALALLAPWCDTRVVVAPRDLALPVDPAMRVEDAGVGPLGGIVAGLDARPHDRALVLGVDFPMVRSDLFAALLAKLVGVDAVVPAPGAVAQPLVAAYGPGARARLAARLGAGERSITAALAGLRVHRIEDPELAALGAGAGALLNVNTPADLERAERLLAVREDA